MNIAVLGYGYWGPKIVRNFSRFSDCKVLYITDKKQDRLDAAKALYPKSECCKDIKRVLKDKRVDSVAIVLPVSLHYKYAKLALESGKNVLIEKPCTDSLQKLKQIARIAKKNKLSVMVDYTFLYTGAVSEIKKITDKKLAGNILFFDSQRMNSGIFRNDVNVVWDLAVHDISIMLYVLKQKPVSVIATGVSHTSSGLEDTAYLSFKFKDGKTAHISCSWMFPFKNKRTVIAGDKKTIVYNDVEPAEKIKIYDICHDIKREGVLADYREGNIFVPKLSQKEALYNMCRDFIDCVDRKKKPLTDISFAMDVSSVLSACSESLKKKGKAVPVK